MDAFKNASNLVVPSLCEFIVFATEFTAGLIIAILMPPSPNSFALPPLVPHISNPFISWSKLDVAKGGEN